MFVDDTAFQRALKQLDPADREVFGVQMEHFGDWAEDPAQLVRTFLEVAPTEGPIAAASACEVSRALAPVVGCTARTVAVLDDIYERWDGLGIPFGKRGNALAWEARVIHVAEQAATWRTRRGDDGARAEIERRAGGHLDPQLARSFVEQSPMLLPWLDAADMLGAALSREPWPRREVGATGLDEFCRVLGTVADLKSTYLIGHKSARRRRRLRRGDCQRPPQGIARPARCGRDAAQPRLHGRAEFEARHGRDVLGCSAGADAAPGLLDEAHPRTLPLTHRPRTAEQARGGVTCRLCGGRVSPPGTCAGR